jgi:gluconolactonase
VQHGLGRPERDGVRCYGPDGALLGKIHIPETVANLTFGGRLRNRLYICGSTSLYACYVDTQGAMKP